MLTHSTQPKKEVVVRDPQKEYMRSALFITAGRYSALLTFFSLLFYLLAFVDGFSLLTLF